MSTATAAEVGLVVVSECTGVVLSQTLADSVKLHEPGAGLESTD